MFYEDDEPRVAQPSRTKVEAKTELKAERNVTTPKVKTEHCTLEVKVKTEHNLDLEPARDDVASAADYSHAKACTDRDCVRCAWVDIWPKASKASKLGVPMGDLLPAESKILQTSWLTSGINADDGAWGLSCAVCARASSPSPWGSYQAGREQALVWCVRRHATSKGHLEALMQFAGLPGRVFGAPPLSEFVDLFHKMRKGDRLREAGVSSSDKTELMWWCVSEAMLAEDRAFLGRAATISLARDARRQRLVIRFGAADEKAQVRFGFLGMQRDGGDTAMDIVQGTNAILKRFCTHRFHPPRWYAGPRPQFDESLFNHVRTHVELMISDAAANEMLAADISRGRRQSGKVALGQLMPNIKMVARDYAHSFRRTFRYRFLKCKHLNTQFVCLFACSLHVAFFNA